MGKAVNEGVILEGVPDSVKNGKIPESMMERVIEGKPWFLINYAKVQMLAFFAAAKAELGFDLTFIAGAGSAYRTYERQLQMFMERMTPGGGGKVTRTFQGKLWSLKPDKAQCATPGGSNHGWAVAGDLCHAGERALSSTDRARLRPIAARFAIADTVRSENWHWVVLRRLEGENAGTGKMAVTSKTPAESLPILDIGDADSAAPSDGTLLAGAVMYLEYTLVAAFGLTDIKVDGTFDVTTEAAVRLLQAHWNISSGVTGVVDLETWKTIQYVAASKNL